MKIVDMCLDMQPDEERSSSVKLLCGNGMSLYITVDHNGTSIITAGKRDERLYMVSKSGAISQRELL